MYGVLFLCLNVGMGARIAVKVRRRIYERMEGTSLDVSAVMNGLSCRYDYR